MAVEFMTRAELERVSNRQRPSAQIRWLERLRLSYKVDADGWPVVAWQDYFARDNQPQPKDEPQLRLTG